MPRECSSLLVEQSRPCSRNEFFTDLLTRETAVRRLDAAPCADSQRLQRPAVEQLALARIAKAAVSVQEKPAMTSILVKRGQFNIAPQGITHKPIDASFAPCCGDPRAGSMRLGQLGNAAPK
jgi:hypothetical protein